MMPLFWIGIGMILMAFAHAARDDIRNARAFRNVERADISEALKRDQTRWN